MCSSGFYGGKTWYDSHMIYICWLVAKLEHLWRGSCNWMQFVHYISDSEYVCLATSSISKWHRSDVMSPAISWNKLKLWWSLVPVQYVVLHFEICFDNDTVVPMLSLMFQMHNNCKTNKQYDTYSWFIRLPLTSSVCPCNCLSAALLSPLSVHRCAQQCPFSASANFSDRASKGMLWNISLFGTADSAARVWIEIRNMNHMFVATTRPTCVIYLGEEKLHWILVSICQYRNA